MSAVENEPEPAGPPARPRPRRRPTRFPVRWAVSIGVAGVIAGSLVVLSDLGTASQHGAAVIEPRLTSVGDAETTMAPDQSVSPSPTPDAVRTVVPARRATSHPDPGDTTGTTAGGASVLYRGRTVTNCLSARGIPSCGAFIGAAIGGNADPASVRSTLGNIALRRTYYQASQVTKAVATARADVAAGRVPWISFKVPYSWADMAAGQGDAWARGIASQLATIDGPVWIAFHHEPEGDGVMKDWTAMQAHLSPIVRSTAPNVAFTIITTGWNQVYGTNPSYSLDALWPGDGLVDIVAFDSYNEYGVVKNGKTITQFTELKSYYDVLSAFAKKHHTHWAIGETGYTDQGAAKDPDWLPRAASDLVRMGGSGLAYFDSALNSQGSWPLDTPAKQAAFRDALAASIHLK